MRVVLQRVSRAEVRVEGEVVGRVGTGYLVLAGFHSSDGEEELCLDCYEEVQAEVEEERRRQVRDGETTIHDYLDAQMSSDQPKGTDQEKHDG